MTPGGSVVPPPTKYLPVTALALPFSAHVPLVAAPLGSVLLAVE